MMKFHLNIAINKKLHNAGTKANADCKNILINNGYTDLEVSFVKSAWLFPVNLAKLLFKLAYCYYRIPAHSFIITQYPLLGINKYFVKYAALLRKKKCKVCCIIHDLDSLRDKPGFAAEAEIKCLSAYDMVIAHTPQMSSWLKGNGYKGQIIEITLFDYLVDSNVKNAEKTGDSSSIIFAGNLAKCAFINDINKIPAIHFNLYGPGVNENMKHENHNFQWLGTFPVNEIIWKINGKYGLVWDGQSIYECTGIMGNYLRYNAPHKLSLYLAAGLPVIFPKTGALASFVEQNKIGITIDSLLEMEDKIKAVTAKDYEAMRQNCTRIGKLLQQGGSLTAALLKAEAIWKEDEKVNQP